MRQQIKTVLPGRENGLNKPCLRHDKYGARAIASADDSAGQQSQPHAGTAKPKALNSIAEWVQRHAAAGWVQRHDAEVAFTTSSCISTISSRMSVMYRGYRPTEMWLAIRPKRGGIRVVPM